MNDAKMAIPVAKSPAEQHHGPYHRLKYHFRWPVRVLGDCEIEVIVPVGNGGAPVIDPHFVEHFQLNDSEVAKAELAALRQVALFPEA